MVSADIDLAAITFVPRTADTLGPRAVVASVSVGGDVSYTRAAVFTGKVEAGVIVKFTVVPPSTWGAFTFIVVPPQDGGTVSGAAEIPTTNVEFFSAVSTTVCCGLWGEGRHGRGEERGAREIRSKRRREEGRSGLQLST